MTPPTRPPDPRTGSARIHGSQARHRDTAFSPIGRFGKVALGAVLTALSAYLLTYPLVGVAIGAVIVALGLITIGPLLVLKAVSTERSFVPVGSPHRSIDGNTPTAAAEAES